MAPAQPKRIVIIQGHPDPAPERYCRALAARYEQGAREAGHEVRTIDVASLDLPLLRTQADFETGEAPPDIRTAQEALKWAEHILIIHPLWLGTMPALLKAFFEQTLRPNFAYSGETLRGLHKRLLQGRSARLVITMGMPALVYQLLFGAHGVKSLLHNILNFVGIRPVRVNLIGMIEIAPKHRARWLEKMEHLGRRGL